MIKRFRLACFSSLWVLIAAVLVPGESAAQASPARLVQANDGSLYLIAGTNAWTVVPDQATDADVSALTIRGSTNATLPSAAVSTDMGVLTAFSGKVLLPDPTVDPFTNLTLWSVQADHDSYTVAFRDGAGIWEFVGNAAHQDYDDWNSGCPGANYCASPRSEVFRGSQALGPKSALLHSPAPQDVAAMSGLAQAAGQ